MNFVIENPKFTRSDCSTDLEQIKYEVFPFVLFVPSWSKFFLFFLESNYIRIKNGNLTNRVSLNITRSDLLYCPGETGDPDI